jgi:ABC-type transport system involved in cytochrome c biogenesis permease subunit
MWHNFELFAFISVLFWVLSIASAGFRLNKLFVSLPAFAGIASLSVFIVLLWETLERPPMRTIGETRLWYSFFLASCGYIIFLRWRLAAILAYSLSMAALFLSLNYLYPEAHNKVLVPALQSVWFVPHVIVYMLAYALLGLSAVFGTWGLFLSYKGKLPHGFLRKIDNIVYIGFGFLAMGLIFGALWAKEAWGHYWTWDPKEVWAFITWAVYLIYIHTRIKSRLTEKHVFIFLLLCFLTIIICWLGISYLPASQNSLHVYS